ncbi:MAG: HepT-like ribonuclease domain-containing protein [Burkholderiales bacterium]
MTEPASRDSSYLGHMLEAIERIRRYVGRKRRVGFLGNPLLQDAVIRNIEIVGEAAGRVSPEFAARHPEIPWREIVGMRHRLIHGYLKVNLATVWEVVERDLPALEPGLRALLGRPPKPPAARRIARKRRVSGSRRARDRVPGKLRR